MQADSQDITVSRSSAGAVEERRHTSSSAIKGSNRAALCSWFSRRFSAKAVITLTLAALVFWQLGQAATIHAKAVLAQHLIERAWQQTLSQVRSGVKGVSGRELAPQIKPWPWADTWPVARLQWLEEESAGATTVRLDLYVLAGAQGASLAFGPGHMQGTALPGEGPSAIAAHRDTHFRFLQHLQGGDLLRVQTPYGSWLDYRVIDTEVVNSDEQAFRVDPGLDRLYLITCFPFDALQAGGPLRYVVRADLISPV